MLTLCREAERVLVGQVHALYAGFENSGMSVSLERGSDVQRLLREEGLFCWWEHTSDAASASLGSHTLVIADHNGAFGANAQPVVRFTASDATLGEDSLTRWASVGRVASARVAMRSRDHRSLGARPVEASVGANGSAASPLSALAVVDVPGAYAYEDTEQGQRLATRQAEALAAVRTRALARGPWRRAQVGTAFTLVDHPRHDGSDAVRDGFVVLAAQHRARNNFSADEAARFVGLTRAILRDQGRAGRRKCATKPRLRAACSTLPSRPTTWCPSCFPARGARRFANQCRSRRISIPDAGLRAAIRRIAGG